jgi:hypothetical protein
VDNNQDLISPDYLIQVESKKLAVKMLVRANPRRIDF